MRKNICKLITILGLFLWNPILLFADQGFGAEITWTCEGNGKYKFRLKFYGNCAGIPPLSFQSITSNSSVPAFPVFLVQTNDISATGLQASGITSCLDCTNSSSSNPIPGLVKEYIYESADIQLNGTPPLSGWWFRWGACCRSTSVTNILSTNNSLGATSFMFPYNGQSGTPCFDSSPYFSEPPQSLFCTGQPYKFPSMAIDPDGDQLVYSWDAPTDSGGAPLNFVTGYYVNNPFPGIMQNPLNVPVVLDTLTGEFAGVNYTEGCYVTAIKVSSYKCGQKVAEVVRYASFTFSSNCPALLGGVVNSPPDVSAPFVNPVSGLQTAYADTVLPGDTVSFFLNATDFEFFINGLSQNITITGSGMQFGDNFVMPQIGCPIPPCATLSSPLPISFQIGGGIGFNWVTTCAHAGDPAGNCADNTNTYTFVLRAADNYCPANGIHTCTFTITVVGAVITVPPVQGQLCTNSGPVTLTAWPPGGTWSGAVNGNQFDPGASGLGNHVVYYTYTDSTGCTSVDEMIFNVSLCTGLDDMYDESNIQAYPNPVHNILNIRTSAPGEQTLIIYGIAGNELGSYRFSGQAEIPVEELAGGLYYYEIRGAGNEFYAGRFVKD